jgi:glycosyltransferase involved in cell wall biosynthesis
VRQSYRNIEIILSDNSSTDDTPAILHEYARKYDCKLIENETNIGAGANFNRLISLAQGEFIAIYHADDVYDENIVKESIGMLMEKPSIGLVGTMGTIIGCDGEYLRDLAMHSEIRRLGSLIFTFDEAMLCAMRNCFVTPSIMVRKSVYQEVGGFDQSKYKSACDYEMWLRIALKYNVAFIDKKLIQYRLHEGQGSEAEVRRNLEVPDIIWVLKEYSRFLKTNAMQRYCNALIDKWLYKAAKKQNRGRLYAKSNETLKLIKSKRYIAMKIILLVFNNVRFSLK